MTDPSTSNMLSTTLTVAVSANSLFNLALGWFTWNLRASAAKVSHLEDKLTLAEQAHDAKQHELTNKLIDARLRDFTHQLAGVMQKLQTTSDAQEAFVRDAERKMERLGEKDHEAELKVLREIKDMQVEMAREGATKDDLRRHEEAMRKELGEVRRLTGH